MMIMDTKGKMMITCEESTFLISKKQQDKLTASEQMQLIFHLLMCKYCRRFASQISLITKAIFRMRKKMEQHSTHICLTDEQKQKIKKALKEQQSE